MSSKESEFEAIVKMKLLALVEEYQTKKEKSYEKLCAKGYDHSDYYLKDISKLVELNNLNSFLGEMQNPYCFSLAKKNVKPHPFTKLDELQ